MFIISNKLKLVIFLLLCSSLGFAQGAIYINGSQSATGASTAATSNNGAVDTFMLQYYTTGTPASLSIQIEGDNGSGSFVICGAASTTTTSGQIKCVGDYKQVRYNLTTLTGGSSPTVTTTLLGNSSADEPTGTAAAQVQGAFVKGTAIASAGNPVPIACDSSTSGTVTSGQTQIVRCGNDGTVAIGHSTNGQDAMSNSESWIRNDSSFAGIPAHSYSFNGATWDRSVYCNKTAFISGLAAATAQIVALSAGTKIRVCSINLGNTNATASNIKLVEGTGALCATGQTQLTGNYAVPASGNINP